MLSSGRNKDGLTESQIEYCQEAWTLLCGNERIRLDDSEAQTYGSRTRFVEGSNKVILGADAWPAESGPARSRLSVLACLAHEWAHAKRYKMGFDRPVFHEAIPLENQPEVLVDEAETSLHASFHTSVLRPKDVEDLIEDARDLLDEWLRIALVRRRVK